ncbi:hypothetical protein ElyMa_001213200 [Elysia marginata]|uniref:Uncharacterized protein n=1 Tax=Elysia marginata TaxID=1093978 RepID=A0AAV4IAE3_9GAST|nr:hypothetical protein ElyMa_001213200 [Elysia marginata]
MKKASGNVNLGIKDKDGKLLQDNTDIFNRWTEYIDEDLFNDERPEKPSIDVSDSSLEKKTSEVVKGISDLLETNLPVKTKYQQNYFKPWEHLEKKK